MANQFSTEQQREIIESFKLFDKDNDGHLTKEVCSGLGVGSGSADTGDGHHQH